MKFSIKLFSVIILATALFGCDPLDDVYDELDALEDEVGEDAGVTLDHVLTSDDYTSLASTIRSNGTSQDSVNADFVGRYEAFNANIEIQTLFSDFLDDTYPQFRTGAAVVVTYNLLEGESFFDGSSDYVNATNYTLSADDYASVSAEAGSFGFFDSETDAVAELTTILSSAIQDPVAGDIASASYAYINSPFSTLTGETIFEEPFEVDLGNFESIDITGAGQVWAWGSFGDDTYARMSGFDGGAIENEDWLVSPAIDLSGQEGDITLSLTQILNFQGDSEWGEGGELDILYSLNYTGDVSTTEWISVGSDLSAYPEGDNYDLYDAEVALSEAAGNTINVAFSYRSTSDFAALWEIVNFRIDAGAAPVTDVRNLFYEFDGAGWSTIEDQAYFFGSADYNAMGAPGRFDNFSEDEAPEDYIPGFLVSLFPFAQEGDEYVVVYDYYNGSFTSTVGDVYTFTAGAWVASVEEDQLIEKKDQFKNTGAGFVFNPSVELTMTPDDYQLIVDEVAKTRPELINSFGTAEDYYGADSFFENFDTRVTSRLDTGDDGNLLQPEYGDLTTAEQEALIKERLVEGVDLFLELRFSDVQLVPGIDVIYTVNYATYDGNDGSGTLVFLLTDVGTFEQLVGN